MSLSSSSSPLERIVFIQRVIKFSAPEVASCVRYATVCTSWFDCFANYGTPIFENLIKVPLVKQKIIPVSDDDEEDCAAVGGQLMIVTTQEQEDRVVRRENGIKYMLFAVKRLSWQECLVAACTARIDWVVDQLLPAAARFLTETMLKEVSLGFVSCAVAAGDINIVKKLIDFGAICESDRHVKFLESNYSNLFGNLDDLRAALARDARVRDRNNSGPYYAVHDSDEDETLYQSPPGGPHFSPDEIFSHQFLPPIVLAFELGRVDIVKLLLTHGARLDTAATFFNQTLIIICCQKAHFELLKWLKENIDDRNGNDDIFLYHTSSTLVDSNITESFGNDRRAVGSRSALDFLAMNSFGDPETRLIKDQHRAVQCARFLVEECSLNPHHIDPGTNCNALHLACGAFANDPRFVKKGQNERNQQQRYQPPRYSYTTSKTPHQIKNPALNRSLHGNAGDDAKSEFEIETISTCNLELIKYLVEECGVDPDQKSKDIATPLAWAIVNLDVATIKYFISLDQVSLSDQEFSAIHFIANAKFKKIFQNSPVESLVKNKAREIIQLLTSERTQCSSDKAKKNFCTIEDAVGNQIVRPLFSCVANRNVLMAELLILEFEADWEAETLRGVDVLAGAAAYDDGVLLKRVNAAIDQSIVRSKIKRGK